MDERKDRQPPIGNPDSRKQELRSTAKYRFTLAPNARIADQNRKRLGKHYANKYRIGR